MVAAVGGRQGGRHLHPRLRGSLRLPCRSQGQGALQLRPLRRGGLRSPGPRAQRWALRQHPELAHVRRRGQGGRHGAPQAADRAPVAAGSRLRLGGVAGGRRALQHARPGPRAAPRRDYGLPDAVRLPRPLPAGHRHAVLQARHGPLRTCVAGVPQQGHQGDALSRPAGEAICVGGFQAPQAVGLHLQAPRRHCLRVGVSGGRVDAGQDPGIRRAGADHSRRRRHGDRPPCVTGVVREDEAPGQGDVAPGWGMALGLIPWRAHAARGRARALGGSGELASEAELGVQARLRVLHCRQMPCDRF
mmetsp:Transcript_111103/g.321111  ORF Transcript_111103/g.321111 Transcript_111103/m.321111 type:complete len:303 (-) Transcript_111103:311-1219(-)